MKGKLKKAIQLVEAVTGKRVVLKEVFSKQEVGGIVFHRTSNDINGIPRYIVHYLNLINSDLSVEEGFKEAGILARKLGGRKYTGRDFGGGYVFSTYSLPNLARKIKQELGD